MRSGLLAVGLLALLALLVWAFSTADDGDAPAAGSAVLGPNEPERPASAAELEGSERAPVRQRTETLDAAPGDPGQAETEFALESATVSGRVILEGIPHEEVRVRLAIFDPPDWAKPGSERFEEMIVRHDAATKRHWSRQSARALSESGAYSLALDPPSAEDAQVCVEAWWWGDSTEDDRVLLARSRAFPAHPLQDCQVEDLLAWAPITLRARLVPTVPEDTAGQELTWNLLETTAAGEKIMGIPKRRDGTWPSADDVLIALLEPTWAGRSVRLIAGTPLLKVVGPVMLLRPGLNDAGTLWFLAGSHVTGIVLERGSGAAVAEHEVRLSTAHFDPRAADDPWHHLGARTINKNTDANGRFSFGPLTPGHYFVMTSKEPGSELQTLESNLVIQELELAPGEARHVELRIGGPLATVRVHLRGLPDGVEPSLTAFAVGGSEDEVLLERGNPAVFRLDPERRWRFRTASHSGTAPQVYVEGEWGPSQRLEDGVELQLRSTRFTIRSEDAETTRWAAIVPEGVVLASGFPRTAEEWMAVSSCVLDQGVTARDVVGLAPGRYQVLIRPMGGPGASENLEEYEIVVE